MATIKKYFSNREISIIREIAMRLLQGSVRPLSAEVDIALVRAQYLYEECELLEPTQPPDPSTEAITINLQDDGKS
jgi:hypothetical protein